MKNKLKKFLSVLCFCFFMILAAGSGCDGCHGNNTSYNNDVEPDSTYYSSSEVEEKEEPEEVQDNVNDFTADVTEDEREAEETYQSDSEEEVSETEEKEEDPSVTPEE